MDDKLTNPRRKLVARDMQPKVVLPSPDPIN